MNFLREQRHNHLLQEMKWFKEQHKELKAKYLGQFIGIHTGRILDHDPDGGNLYKPLRQQHGDLPILIVEVGETAEQEFLRLYRRIVT